MKSRTCFLTSLLGNFIEPGNEPYYNWSDASRFYELVEDGLVDETSFSIITLINPDSIQSIKNYFAIGGTGVAEVGEFSDETNQSTQSLTRNVLELIFSQSDNDFSYYTIDKITDIANQIVSDDRGKNIPFDYQLEAML